MIDALRDLYDHPNDAFEEAARRNIDAILAACPEIAALDHAREGWLDDSDPDAWEVLDHDHGAYALRRVLVVDA
jgi:hypothetical protein